MKQLKIINYFTYIFWRRAYWDSALNYGLNCAATRYFRLQVYRYSIKEQYEYTLKYIKLKLLLKKSK